MTRCPSANHQPASTSHTILPITPVDDIAGIVDVERDGCRLARVAVHPCIDQSVGQSDHVAQVRSILQTRQGRLTRANLSAKPRRRSAIARSITPPFEVRRPPSKAAVIFLA